MPFDAKVVLILNFQNTWEGVVEQCLDRVKDITLDVLMECIDAKFVRYELLRSQLRYVLLVHRRFQYIPEHSIFVPLGRSFPS